MIGWLRNLLEIARQTLLLLAANRFVWVFGVAALVAAVALALVARQAAQRGAPGDEFFGVVLYLVGIQFALPVAVVYLGVVAIHGDLQDRTATYLFVRPLHRSAILLGKWLGVVAAGVGLGAVGVVVTYAALALPPIPWARGVTPPLAMAITFLQASTLAAVAYAAVAALLAAFFRRPLVAGAVFVVGWEAIGSMAPPQAGVRSLTVADPVRRWLASEIQATGPLREVLAMRLDRFVDPSELRDPLASLAWLAGVALLLALWIYTGREYDSRVRE
ncbi:MAG: ABC transporter permease [Planctomycetota bacterium]